MLQEHSSAEFFTSDLEALKLFHHTLSSVENQIQSLLLEFNSGITPFFKEITDSHKEKLREKVYLMRQAFKPLEDRLAQAYPHLNHSQAQTELREVLEQMQCRQALRHYALDALEEASHQACLEMYQHRLEEVDTLCGKKQMTQILKEVYACLNSNEVLQFFI